jgi:hypothetical protein
MTIYTSGFYNQESIKNHKKHNKNTGKQVLWVAVKKGRETKNYSRITLFFGSAEDQTRGVLHARQALYC